MAAVEWGGGRTEGGDRWGKGLERGGCERNERREERKTEDNICDRRKKKKKNDLEVESDRWKHSGWEEVRSGAVLLSHRRTRRSPPPWITRVTVKDRSGSVKRGGGEGGI